MGIATPKKMPAVAKASPPVVQKYVVPPSVGGINSVEPLMGMNPSDCLICRNIMPSEYGMRLRKGYRLWGTNPDAKPINTIIPFEGQAADASQDRLWAVNEDGIWDFTVPDTVAPVQDVVFADQNEGAGFGVSIEFTRDNGDRYLYYADGKNGIHEYSEDLGTWSVPSFTGGIVVDDVAFVMSWKNRMWMVEENSGLAWYTDVNSQAGQVTKFVFGSKFEHGGEVKALYNWTVDGGDGIDDMLVVIGRGGDVLIYKGLDPDLPSSDPNTMSLVGSYFIGEVPETRRIGVEYGGELYLLSTFGITSVRDLLQGVDPSTPSGPAVKISRFVRDTIVRGKDELNWAMHIHPADGFLQIVAPYDSPSTALQLNQNLLTQAWGLWKGVPVNSAGDWNAKYYIGDKIGNVWLYDGTLDGAAPGVAGTPIDYDLLTSFQPPNGNHTDYKRVGFIRAIGIGSGEGSLNVGAIYDYAIAESVAQPPQNPATGGSIWNINLWDAADSIWDFPVKGVSTPVGANGIGRVVAVSLAGSASTRITVLGFDVTYTQGGFL